MANGDDNIELNDSRIWQIIIVETQFLPNNRMDEITPQCDSYCRIIDSSIEAAKRRL